MARLKLKVHFSMVIFFCLLVYMGKALLFANYLLTLFIHELSHAFVAKRLGYNLKNITLTPFGISLNISSNKLSPKDEIKIALAGPVVNLCISLFLISLWWFFPETYNFTHLFCFTNMITCFFNFLPAFPLDGGRIFRAILRQNKGDKFAIKTSFAINYFLCFMLIAMFFLSFFLSPNFTYLFVIACIIPSKKGDCEYSFIDYSLIKKKSKLLKIKNIYIKDSELLYKACKFIDSFSYLNLYVYDSDDNLIKIIAEKELLQIFEKFSATTSIKNCIKSNKSTF